MQMINGKTKVCGIIANPVEHTLSPLLHNTLAHKLGINMIYVPFKPNKQGVKASVEGAYELDIMGLNVSVPYKQDVIPYLSEIDSAAKEIGAVNTLVRTNNGYKGYNTDTLGLLKALQQEEVGLKDQEILLLGAGGVAKAAAYLCCQQEAKKVYLLNRTLERAKQLSAEINSLFDGNPVVAFSLDDYRSIPYKEDGYIAIQTTSVGMYPKTEHAVIEDESFYKNIKIAHDLIYTPFETKFMQLAKAQRAQVQNGLSMLLFQGVAAFELWNHVSVPDDVIQYCYQCMKEELQKR